MGDKCSHCDVELENCYVEDVFVAADSLSPVVEEIIRSSNTGHSVWNNSGRQRINMALQKHAEQPKNHTLTLRNLLPPNHQVYIEIEKNIELEKEFGIPNKNTRLLVRFNELHELAESQRKYAKKTRDWMKHKSPFMHPDFRNKLTTNQYIHSVNILQILNQECQRKEIICINCGTVVRTFIDMQEKIELILESVQIFRTYVDCFSRYDSAMANWERDDKAMKAEAAKIRKEKKLQADIEEFEAQRRSAEEKLRKLKDE